MAIDACVPRQLIEAGYLRTADLKGIEQLADYLQVTVGHLTLIYNLGLPGPALVNDFEGAKKLMDPHKFVEHGFIPSYFIENDITSADIDKNKHYMMRLCLQ